MREVFVYEKEFQLKFKVCVCEKYFGLDNIMSLDIVVLYGFFIIQI